ncbi:MAG: hypothetical protein AUJ92_00020 [Armatimonadetes bacterium CG2_30_59_28]|nr:hypothetical protein [Armatimonadota bacterium]OIO99119.1 MAG: hypothetical protein AUJ92_00020 [Armatimonadetes bacterium CG2_30_59_28]PIU60857.1 MAG: hypothetical protein COS85_22410 [Armatimonadetes bacterium CG07_land_8_20_14_0_80_59_28]PIX38467.1 MAG: hypothetical protein COZ56_20385 [Armatimonadetes bacterium CG_4_8_14_3_um_filter_58_9]PIY42564.1 MAG: hypothetical protein COZ05_13535 [Armatimonadetes bacterium CG_4_10_14_3_um_filter_59_10]PJB62917.1 MAG: hypothetical protein CO095_175
MFCPDCKYEFAPHTRRCSDCGADLVEELPQQPPVARLPVGGRVPTEADELVTVSTSNLPGAVAMARSLLDATGFWHECEGLALYHFGYATPVVIRVQRRDLSEVKELLSGLESVSPNKLGGMV